MKDPKSNFSKFEINLKMAVPYTHSVKDLTLSCSPSGPVFEDKSAGEYVIEKCTEYISNGKTTCTIDATSGESYTFAEFVKLSKSITSSLYKRGMRKGDIVVYMCYDIVKLHIFLTGVWNANGVARSLYPEELEDSILQTVRHSKSKWILCDKAESPKCLAAAKKVNWPVEVITMDRDVEGCTSIHELFQDEGDQCPLVEAKGGDPALILCTSGTTGRSKGALHTHSSIISSWQMLANMLPLGERNLYLGRGTHISGGMIAMLSIVNGKICLITSKITLENFYNAIDVYKPNWIFAFPAFLLSLANDLGANKIDKSSIEFISCGGTNVKFSMEAELKLKCPNMKFLSGVYGMTESVPLIATHQKPDTGSDATCQILKDLPVGSMGKVCVGVSAQIRDDAGNPLGPNEEGELCVKSTTMFTEYVQQVEETQKAFTADKWFRTGDILTYDENGFFYFCGRQKEMFKCSGNHVFPAEIDEVLSKHPSVADVCTVGVDDPAGEKMPRAFVVLKPGTTTTTDEIIEFAHERLPPYKHLRGGLYTTAELPKGTTGKVTRLLVEKLPVPE